MANVNFSFGKYADYKALEVKDAGTLYFTSDTHQLFKGPVEYTKSVRIVENLPSAENGEQGVFYVKTPQMTVHAFNGSDFIQVTKEVVTAIPASGASDDNIPSTKAVADYVSGKVAEVMGQKGSFVTDVTYDAGVLTVDKGDATAAVKTTLTGVVHAPTYDAETRTIKMPVFGGDELTINLGKDMVVKSGAYNAATKEIQLTISTGEVVKIPAAALVDVYTGGASNTASVTVSDQNVISVDVKVSAVENNNIEIKEDGLYVANPDAYTRAQTDEKIKAVNDALSGHSGDKVAHITAEERTAWNAKATIENVATAKSEAISAASTDAQNKANAALDSAKEYANGLNTAMDTRVNAVEGQLTWQTIAAHA